MFLEKYSSVTQLGKHSDVLLVREETTGKLFVKRRINALQLESYKYIQSIDNSHIPKIYNICDLGNDEYDVYEEYIYGKTLEEILTDCKTIERRCAIKYIMQLLDVLTVIHNKGLIHRDIKPSNIIISDNDVLFLIDFDITRIRKDKKICDTDFLGTQGFAAPEQYGFHQTDTSSDVYSVGVLFNIMLTGLHPAEKLYPGALGRIIRRCTAMDSKQRYKNARALKRALNPYNTKSNLKIAAIIRQLPGFRSMKVWKMLIALFYYFLWGVVVVFNYLPLDEEPKGDTLFMVTGLLLYYAYVFFFAFDSFGLRSRVRWIEDSRGHYLMYFLKCLFWLVLCLAFMLLFSGLVVFAVWESY